MKTHGGAAAYMSKYLSKSVSKEGLYEFTSSGILCTNHINCRDQLCVNLDTGELIRRISIRSTYDRKNSKLATKKVTISKETLLQNRAFYIHQGHTQWF